jgi:hypothetical protein
MEMEKIFLSGYLHHRNNDYHDGLTEEMPFILSMGYIQTIGNQFQVNRRNCEFLAASIMYREAKR